MNAQDLKNSILQLAVQGKLVEQRPEEGTAKELLARIKAEKEQLIKDKKIKKEKPLPEITDEEKPFEIPASWKWVRLNDLCSKIGSGSTPLGGKNIYKDSGIKFLRSQNVYNDGLRYEGLVYIGEEQNKPNSEVYSKDILLNITGGSIGRCAIVPDDFDVANINQHIMIIRNIDFAIRFWMHFVLISAYIQKNIMSVQVGVSREGLSAEKLKKFLIPLPPLEEQKRIVAKIEELLPYIEQYDKAYTKLEIFNKKFPEDMKKSILQYAIRGKLVEQRPEEGNAEDLYKQIVEEKAKLIKEGKIKKEKPLPEITEEEIPFEIPSSWKWVRFAEFGSYKKGPFGSALTKGIFVPKSNDTIKVYEQKNAIQKDANLGEYYITKEYFENKMQGFEVSAGDIIVSCAGTIGETYIIPEEFERGIINQALMRMRLMPSVYVDYFLLYFDVILKQTARKSSKGSAIKNIPPFDELKAYLVPLPPLEEQKRIVARLEEILPYCNQLVK